MVLPICSTRICPIVVTQLVAVVSEYMIIRTCHRLQSTKKCICYIKNGCPATKFYYPFCDARRYDSNFTHSSASYKYYLSHCDIKYRGRRGRDIMVVGFTTTYAISTYHHWCCEFESRSRRGVQHYVIKLVSDLLQVGGFLRVLRLPPAKKLTTTI